jgi:hypothetical protein
MFKKKKQILEPIQLKLKLPENGAYPPRIVSPGYSLWLRGASVTDQDITFIKNAANRWLITPPAKHDILINGVPIQAETILSDGDYIRKGVWKGIFQADPVADYRQGIKEIAVVSQINPTQAVREWVILDGVQVSLDGGQHFTHWDDIVRMQYETSNKKWSVTFYFTDNNNKLKTVPSKLKALTNDDFSALLQWIIYHVPFDPNLYSFFTPIWSDAYESMAYEKVLIPAENNQRPLPEALNKVLAHNERSKWDNFVFLVMPFVISLILSILTTKPKDFSSASIMAVAVGFGVIMCFFGVFLGLKMLENWYLDYKMRRFDAAEIAAAKEKEPPSAAASK